MHIAPEGRDQSINPINVRWDHLCLHRLTQITSYLQWKCMEKKKKKSSDRQYNQALIYIHDAKNDIYFFQLTLNYKSIIIVLAMQ